MSIIRRREIYISLTFIIGILTIVDYFIRFDPLNTVSATLRNWAVLLAYFAIVIGLVNIFIIHANIVIKRAPQWIYSAWLLFILISITFIGVCFGVEHPIYRFLFTNVYGVLGPCGYGIMAFFIASAAFRALRGRSLEAMTLVVTLIITLLYRAPIGGLIPYIPVIGNWIQLTPVTGGMRGIIIGMALGALGMALRTLLGYERGYLPKE